MKRSGRFMKIEGFIGHKFVTSYVKLDTDSEEENYYEVEGIHHKGTLYRKDFDKFINQRIVKL